jgi:hypothetical protein
MAGFKPVENEKDVRVKDARARGHNKKSKFDY